MVELLWDNRYRSLGLEAGRIGSPTWWEVLTMSTRFYSVPSLLLAFPRHIVFDVSSYGPEFDTLLFRKRSLLDFLHGHRWLLLFLFQ